jgi:hypothetical protein
VGSPAFATGWGKLLIVLATGAEKLLKTIISVLLAQPSYIIFIVKEHPDYSQPALVKK